MPDLLFGRPSKIVCVGSNYRCHAAEMGRAVPEHPRLFLKPPSALCGPGEAIEVPTDCGRVDHEAELAVVMGQRARGVSIEDAMACVAGFTAANDVTARQIQSEEKIFTRAKGFDTFCPVGPRVVSGLDPSALDVTCRVNGETRQSGNTADLVFSIPVLISFITSFMTLEPGDLLLTGTPMGVGPLNPGELVEVEIEGIGVLSNPVVARS